MKIILFLSIITSVASFHLRATMTPRPNSRGYISTVTFPDLKIRNGLKLIHSPAQWANGAGLIFGISPFDIVHCGGLFVCGDRKILHMNVVERESRKNLSVTFDSLSNMDSRITFRQQCIVDETLMEIRHCIRFKLSSFTPDGTGFMLTVFTSVEDDCTNDNEIDLGDEYYALPGTDRFPDAETKLIRESLLTCVADDIPTPSDPLLLRYMELVNPDQTK